MPSIMTDPPPTYADTMAADFAPKLVVILESKKAEIVASAGGWIARNAVKAAWHIFIVWVPWLIARVIEYAANRWGKMTVNEMLSTLTVIRATSQYPNEP